MNGTPAAFIGLTALALVGAAAPALAADAAPGADAVAEPTALPPLAWPDLADLTLAAPVVLRARIDKVRRLSGRDAADVPPGEIRAVVNASLLHVLRAPGALGPKAAWQWQGKARGSRPAEFAPGREILVFARPAGADGDVEQYRLLSPAAMQPWSAELEEEVRKILLADADPAQHGLMVTGVDDGFHTPGPIDGASESQFFLSTRSGRRLALTVRRTPGAAPEIRVATGEMVDRALEIRPQTLLSLGLACGMPEALPARLGSDADLARDYAEARAKIGPCGRQLEPPAA